MLFPVRQQIEQPSSLNATLGGSCTFQITRDFFLSSAFIVVPITVDGTITSAVTYQTMGLVELIKSVQLSIADGSSNRNQTFASGGALVRRAARLLSGLDAIIDTVPGTIQALGASLNEKETASAGSSAGTYNVVIPLLFRHPQISDPIGSATMLPLPRYNTNPVLTVQFGQLSDAIITNHGATISIGTPHLVEIKRQVDNILFPTIDTEFKEVQVSLAATGQNLRQTLDVPGSYTAIDIYTTNSTGTGADISNGPWNLQFLSQVLRRFYLSDVKRMEQFSLGNDCYLQLGSGAFLDLFPGFYHLDFVHDEYGMEVGELGSLLNVNLLAGSGSLLEIIMNIGSTGTVNFATERLFGDLSPYTFSFKTAAG